MQQDILNVKIKGDDSLIDFERHNSTIHMDGAELRMYLSKNYEKKFFASTRISSLIVTACHANKKFTLTDWSDQSNDDNINLRLSNSLVGITSVCLVDRIENTKHELLNINVGEFIKSLALGKRGLIDNSEAGQDFIFCSFDSKNNERYFPRPIALPADNIVSFTEQFLNIKRKKIDFAFGVGNEGQISLFGQYDTYEKEKGLAALVFELYENTIQHGNKDENNELIEGVRTFTIKRHIVNRTEEFRKQTEDFPELLSYFTRIAKEKKNKKLWFYEISIVDNGIGIVKRFLTSRPEYKNDPVFSKLTDFEKLNYIISESLSSKLFAGAGKGIKNALRNLISLGGFVSLRTNNIWCYFDGTSKVSKISPSFTRVNTKLSLDDMRGTSYSIILPVSPK